MKGKVTSMRDSQSRRRGFLRIHRGIRSNFLMIAHSQMKNDSEDSKNYYLQPDARLRLADILGLGGRAPLLGIKRTKFYELVGEGKLPRPQKIGRASLWRVGDLLAAMDSLTVESEKD